jgi:hypothetical protein
MGGSDEIRRNGMGVCPVLDWSVVKRLETMVISLVDIARIEWDWSYVQVEDVIVVRWRSRSRNMGKRNALASGFQRFLHGYVTTALTSTSTLIPMFFVVHHKHW